MSKIFKKYKAGKWFILWAMPILILIAHPVYSAPPAHPGTVIIPPERRPPGLNQPFRKPGKTKKVKAKTPPARTTGNSTINRLAAVDVPLINGIEYQNPLFLLLSFSDQAFSATNAANYSTFMFSDAPSVLDNTLADYYREVSDGKFIIEGDGNSISWVNMSAGGHSYAYYVDGASGFGSNPGQNAWTMVQDALDIAAVSVSLSDFDNDGPDRLPRSAGSMDDDGQLDALVVVHAGPAAEYFGTQNSIDNNMASHYRAINLGTYEGVQVVDYIMVPERDPVDPSTGHSGTLVKTLGTVAHEFGHILGLPDLYDTGDGITLQSYGLGHYDLMSWGLYGTTTYKETYDQTSQKASWDRPGHLSAWSKIYLGWAEPVVVHADTIFNLWRAEDSPPLTTPQYAMLAASSNWVPLTPFNPTEYFLMEHRQSTPGTYDEGFNISDEGAALIYHVDESVLFDSQENLNIDVNNNESRRGVDLEEADGLYQLDELLGSVNGNLGDFLDEPTAGIQGDFYRNGQGNFYNFGGGTVTDPDSDDNDSNPTGINTVFGFGVVSTDPGTTISVDYSTDYGPPLTNSVGYAGTDRAGPFKVVSGTFDDGDSDSAIRAGQTVTLSLKVKHTGIPNTARGVRALIDSPDFSSITNSSVSYGDLPALAQSSGDGEFVFSMAQPAVVFSWIPVTVQMVDDNMNFSEETLLLPVVQAVKKKKGGGGGGCFIATALWGAEHWRTDRLRDYRDAWLITNPPGRWLVDQYYTYSPEPASWVAKRPLVKRAISFLLERLLWPFFL